MLFYSYCPECGTESKPFLTEPSDGTPMHCDYCGNTYPYKTRHWKQQRILVRSILLLVAFVFVLHGINALIKREPKEVTAVLPVTQEVHLANPDSVRRSVRRNAKTDIALEAGKVDARKGLCNGYEWGSGKGKGAKTETVRLGRQAGWDEVRLIYCRGSGLCGFTLTRRDVLLAEFDEISHGMLVPWSASVGRKTTRTLYKGNSSATIFLPQDNISIVAVCDAKKGGRKADLNFTIFNEDLVEGRDDVLEALMAKGYKPVD